VGAVVVPALRPLQVVHAQAMHQQQQLATGLAGRVQRERVQRLTLLAQQHRQGQRVVVGQQPVAQHAVEGRQHRFALDIHLAGRRVQDALQPGFEPAQRGLQAGVDPARRAAHAAVDQTGQAASPPGRTATQPQAGVHRLVHPLDDMGDARGRLGGQARRGTQVGGAQLLPGAARRRRGWLRGGGVGHGQWRGRCRAGYQRSIKSDSCWRTPDKRQGQFLMPKHPSTARPVSHRGRSRALFATAWPASL
jgi:hypothetical protein